MTDNNTHSKLIGYILWLFGFTGSHRFYYGKPVTGIKPVLIPILTNTWMNNSEVIPVASNCPNLSVAVNAVLNPVLNRAK